MSKLTEITIAALAGLLFLCVIVCVARADSPNNPFYKGQTVPNSPVSCCTKKDSKALIAWRQNSAGEYEIYMP